MNTQQMLDALSDYQAQADYLNLAKQEMIDKVLTPEIRAQIADIEYEFEGKRQAVNNNIAELQEYIKSEVLETGATVKGTYLMACFVKGRTGSWDDEKLKGFALVHPEIMACKKPDGEPTVSFRKVGK